MILWIDIETTGLDPTVDKILEVAAIVTNQRGNPCGSFYSLVQVDPESLRMGEYVHTMHTNNGLLADLKKEKGDTHPVSELIRFLKKHGSAPYILGGTNPTFDLGFIEHLYPTFGREFLSHRKVDMNTIYQMDLPTFKKNGRNHRASDDITQDVENYRRTRECLSN